MRSWSRKRGRLSGLVSARPAAILTTVTTLTGVLWVTGPNGWWESVFVGILCLALLGWHAVTPRLAPGVSGTKHASWLPASAATLVLAPFGLGFAPPAPVEETELASTKTIRVGVLALAGVTLALAGIAAGTAVPVTRAAAIAGLIMVSSALVPITPLDGARWGLGRLVSLGATLALAVGTIAVTLGWL